VAITVKIILLGEFFWWWLGVKIDFVHKLQWSKFIFTPNHHQKNSPNKIILSVHRNKVTAHKCQHYFHYYFMSLNVFAQVLHEFKKHKLK